MSRCACTNKQERQAGSAAWKALSHEAVRDGFKKRTGSLAAHATHGRLPLPSMPPRPVFACPPQAEARVTLKPLVDTIPCIGGVSISLLKVPHVDFSLCLMRGVDIMALPIVKDVVKLATKVRGRLGEKGGEGEGKERR